MRVNELVCKYNIRKVVINADDSGLNPDVNKAIIELLKSGRIDRTTLMVNMPFAEEAARLLKEEHLEDAAGIHLNLADGTPLTERIKGTPLCADGQFNRCQMLPSYRFFLKPSIYSAVKEELDCQFRRFYELFGHYPTHVDSHGHFHNFLPYLSIILPLSKKYGVRSMRIAINLFNKKDAGIAKRFYKSFVNAIIKSRFEHTDCMGSYTELLEFATMAEGKTLELMVHPTMKDGKVVDTIFENGFRQYIDFSNIR